jgi:hypothetical protein
MSNQERVIEDQHLCEPFVNGRETGRLLHDLGMILSLLNPAMLTQPSLDFRAGSCGITEMAARMGQRVTAFDIHTDLAGCIERRFAANRRIDLSLTITRLATATPRRLRWISGTPSAMAHCITCTIMHGSL